MGSMMSAISDDEDDWDSLERQSEVYGLQNWKVYSDEARFVEQGFNKKKLKGPFLVKYVELKMALKANYMASQIEDKQYGEFLRLEKIYGSKKST